MEMQVCCNASHRRTLSLSLAFVLCLTTAVGVPSLGAAESTAAQPAAAEAAAPAVKTPAGGGAATNAAATGMGQLISLTLDDVPLAEVVRLFTRISGANIIAATTNLQGQVTANLQDVAWRPAFESILERQNLQLIEKPPASGIFVIEGRKSGEDPRVSTTIKLNYAKVSDIVVLVNSVLGKEGTVTPFASANSIVVNASVLKTDELRKILEQLDRPRTQVSIETKIVQL
ncbi:MAG: secretin N-terminal domain-containing protein, partial [Kiritimatiellia bacterium]